MGGMTTTILDGPAAVFCPDPPWQARDQLPDERGAGHKYETMSTADLCALELPPLAERHVVILWRLASMLPDALQVLDAWGYIAAAEIVWHKLRPCRTCCATGRVDGWRFGEELLLVPGTDRPCPDCEGRGGTPHLGLGHYTRGAHEVAIVARPKRGRAPERSDLSIDSLFAAPMLLDVHGLLSTACTCGHDLDDHPRGVHTSRRPCLGRDPSLPSAACGCKEFSPRKGGVVHSAKPDAFYERVARLYPGPYLEGFSRRTRPGWRAVWSDQDGRLDEVARVMRDVWPAEEREQRLAKARRRAARGRS